MIPDSFLLLIIFFFQSFNLQFSEPLILGTVQEQIFVSFLTLFVLKCTGTVPALYPSIDVVKLYQVS